METAVKKYKEEAYSIKVYTGKVNEFTDEDGYSGFGMPYSTKEEAIREFTEYLRNCHELGKSSNHYRKEYATLTSRPIRLVCTTRAIKETTGCSEVAL